MWAVDKIENGMAILENVETLEKKEVYLTILPASIHEGSILLYQDKQYVLDKEQEEIRRKMIEEKFRNLRNKY